MDLIPDEELRSGSLFNLTPMVDFLFLVVAVFATLALTRTAVFDSEVNLATLQEETATPFESQGHIVTLGITSKGEYKWITEFNEYAMESIPAILQELAKESEMGLLPKAHNKTTILLHVDKKTEWNSAVQLIFSLKQAGYPIHPIYEKEDSV